MLLFKFFFFLVVSLIYRCCSASYVYPLWTSEDQKIEKGYSSDGDATVTEFIIENFVLPMRDGFCNICANFLEVYSCVLEHFEQFRENIPKESPSYLDKTLNLFGLVDTRTDTPQSCSYYSLMVVTITIVLFITLLFVTKKLVEYVKEDDTVFPHILPDYKNKCPCYQEE